MESDFDVTYETGDRFVAVAAESLADHPDDLVVACQQDRRPMLPLKRKELIEQCQAPRPGTF
jgi:hypothetical protein